MAVEPLVSREQLAELLAAGHESLHLDYKRSCDLKDTRAVVELAKDVAAMQVAGGHLVIGADDQGRPVPPGVSAEQLAAFDEANLRPKLAKWIPEPFEIRTASHQIEDCTIAVIYVAPRSDGFCILKADGNFGPPDEQRSVFRAGEVFVRHGTSNDRWRQADIDQILANIVAARKEQWRAELRDDLVQLGIAHDAQRLIDGPVENFTWRLDTASFDSATVELLRRGDDIALQRMLHEATADAAGLLDADDHDELTTVIGRVASVAAQALTYRRPEWFRRSLDTVHAIYQHGFDDNRLPRHDVRPEPLWLIIVEHLLGLGALAVRTADWAAVRAITLRAPGEREDWYRSWLRHGLTMASRANMLDPAGRGGSLVVRAAGRVAALPALRPDLPAAEDQAFTSICQFDLLAALTTIADTQAINDSDWYTNFARFYSSRSEPAVERLLTDELMRDALFPLPDQDLAVALRALSRHARNEGMRYSGWSGFEGAQVREFLDQHPADPGS